MARPLSLLRGLIGRAVDLVLPPRCLLCSKVVDSAGTLCAPCWRGMLFLGEPCCAICGLPFPYDAGSDSVCAACLAHPPSFDRARSVFHYDDHSRGLVLAFKHGDRMQGAPAFGAWMARAGAGLLADADLLVPVPLHWTRLWRRRFNQSAVLALALEAAIRRDGASAPAAAPDLLQRHRRTPQQGRRTRSQRALNVRAAFRLKPGASVAGQRIVLIDDVMTSGATINECARVLRRAGAARVDVLTLARAVRLP
jgi:ComF family protein